MVVASAKVLGNYKAPESQSFPFRSSKCYWIVTDVGSRWANKLRHYASRKFSSFSRLFSPFFLFSWTSKHGWRFHLFWTRVKTSHKLFGKKHLHQSSSGPLTDSNLKPITEVCPSCGVDETDSVISARDIFVTESFMVLVVAQKIARRLRLLPVKAWFDSPTDHSSVVAFLPYTEITTLTSVSPFLEGLIREIEVVDLPENRRFTMVYRSSNLTEPISTSASMPSRDWLVILRKCLNQVGLNLSFANSEKTFAWTCGSDLNCLINLFLLHALLSYFRE